MDPRRRTTLTLLAGVSLASTGHIAAVTISTIAAERLVGTAALAGTPSATTVFGAAVGSALLGLVSASRGRRLAIATGYLVAVLGAAVATAMLIASIPVPDPVAQVERRAMRRSVTIDAEPPSPAELPPGCPFANRCPIAMDVCHEAAPPEVAAWHGGTVRCHAHTTGPTLGGAGIADPFTFFLERAKVALNDGKLFSAAGDGFVRLNFGTPRALLADGLERMRKALAAR